MRGNQLAVGVVFFSVSLFFFLFILYAHVKNVKLLSSLEQQNATHWTTHWVCALCSSFLVTNTGCGVVPIM